MTIMLKLVLFLATSDPYLPKLRQNSQIQIDIYKK
jgi:hypothetical protein